MKLKYYLRGLGVGILITTVILSIAFKVTLNGKIKEAIADYESEEVAKVEKELNDLEALLNPTLEPTHVPTEDANKNKDENSNITETPSITPSVTPSEAPTDSQNEHVEEVAEDTDKETTTETNTEEVGEKIDDVTSNEELTESSEEPAKNEEDNETDNSGTTSDSSENDDFIYITIEKGMNSEDVSSILENYGVIKDSSEFNNYLKKHGYSTIIRVGTFKIAKNATYDQIVESIVKK